MLSLTGIFFSALRGEAVSDVKVLIGDLLGSKAQTLVNTVNCVGVMGKGIALAFKKRFPEMFQDYVERCRAGEVNLGRPYLYKQFAGPWILNFPTKGHWRDVSKLSDIVAGLEHVREHYKSWGIESLAVPPLGCGNGQLDWTVVGPTLHRHLKDLDIPVELFAPTGTPPEQLTLEFLEQKASARPAGKHSSLGRKISPAAVALVAIVSRIGREPYHWPVGRTTFQKIAYFATATGIPTGLKHERASYGPFAADLKPLIARLVNNGLITERQEGKMYVIEPGPTYRDARELYMPQLKEWRSIIEHVADLFLRFPRTTDAELAATVHFVAQELAKENGKPSETDVLAGVKRWKVKRRPPLEEHEVASTVRNLNVLGWVDLEASAQLPLPEDELSIP